MSRRFWGEVELTALRERYADTPTETLAVEIGRSLTQCYQTAARLGLKKSAAYLAGPHAYRKNGYEPGSVASRFKRGQVPANKGLRRPGWSPGRMKETQFAKGQMPKNWMPIGSTRYSKDGYLQLKVAESRNPSVAWKGMHILLWEEAHGAIPTGHAVCFKDRNKGNVVLDNLELISRGDLMRRNTIHNLPKELAEIIQLSGALKRVLRRKYAEQNDGSSQPSVCNVGGAEG